MSLAIVAISVSLVACGGNKNEKAEGEEVVVEEVVVEETPASAESDVLKQYEEIANKVIKFYEEGDMTDANAAMEIAKLSQELAGKSEELQAKLANMSEAEQKKFQDIAQKMAEAAQKAMQQ